jgi:hypothetical protein
LQAQPRHRTISRCWAVDGREDESGGPSTKRAGGSWQAVEKRFRTRVCYWEERKGASPPFQPTVRGKSLVQAAGSFIGTVKRMRLRPLLRS